PTVEITYDPETGKFTVDFSEDPINPETGNPFTPDEIKAIITGVPGNNMDPSKTTVIQPDPTNPKVFIVTTEPTGPSQEVTVKVPAGSYTDENDNPGTAGEATEDIV
ncbi:hypothetical protein, partial [Acinetobacter wuhouensis]|uniref:hypothetical protein n=1 Tax=Acinetobacter wuhouensis TaxID=1879050 RepID=UPI001BC86D52